ncbi:type I glyceraldehyde-3-phosphate dehydrogenase [archaeon]|nr:type I glyceraldehyde-3-phosphate dehydrogenase [archaeon]|tara:strand:+ start:842 stop:1846 length:1005 start_codon:yes stop_codon:yes gene_type:complete
MVRVAINGFGRIGRMFLRAALQDKKVNVVAINDLTDTKTLATLFQYDSVHGKYPNKVSATKNSLKIGAKTIPIFNERDPEKLPWKKYKVDVVLESTGVFRDPVTAAKHLKAGAKKVILSAPAKPTSETKTKFQTIVMGVNEKTYKKSINIISNASCTTNCVAPTLKIINDQFGINNCMFTTIHSYTADQRLVDAPHKDLRRARAAALNIIPTSTGADIATTEVIPQLKGKLKGTAFRVPVPDGSVTDFVIQTKKKVTVESINQTLKTASKKELKGILEFSEGDLVSTDIIGNPHSAIVDSKLTSILKERVAKLVVWYDNEWGYSVRLVDLMKLL